MLIFCSYNEHKIAVRASPSAEKLFPNDRCEKIVSILSKKFSQEQFYQGTSEALEYVDQTAKEIANQP